MAKTLVAQVVVTPTTLLDTFNCFLCAEYGDHFHSFSPSRMAQHLIDVHGAEVEYLMFNDKDTKIYYKP